MQRIALNSVLAALVSTALLAQAQQDKTPPSTKAATLSPAISVELFKPEGPDALSRLKLT